MIIERTEHREWLTNAYLVADRPGGHGVLIDANAMLDPLIAKVRELDVTVTHILVTHHHMDHVAEIGRYREEFDAPIAAHSDCAAALGEITVDLSVDDGDVMTSGDLALTAMLTPGHCHGHLAFLVDGNCFTSDVLFKGSVGGTGLEGGSFDGMYHSVMDRLMSLPPETRVHPGHREPTTIGEEWEHNAFVRLWRGLDAEGAERVTVGDAPARLVLWAPDYDGGNKALVEFDDGERAIVGGSRVTRTE